MKTGRNEPCHCGSGRKYKHCCLADDEAREHALRRRTRIADDARVRLLKYAGRLHGPGGVQAAWADLARAGAETLAGLESADIAEIVVPWYLYDWTPDPVESELPRSRRHPLPVAAALLADDAVKLPPDERDYIAAALDSAFSFHEILALADGGALHVRDVLLGTEATVLDADLDYEHEPHDIVYGRVLHAGGQALFADTARYVFDPLAKVPILALRARLRAAAGTPTAADLRGHHRDIVTTCLELVADLLDPTPPEVRNTDGDLIEFHVLTFTVPSAQAAFDALGDLTLEPHATLHDDTVRRDATGALTRIEWRWQTPGNAMHAAWENTVLGHLRADGDQLVVEVNSARRAAMARDLVEARMGAAAQYVGTEILDPDSAFDPDDGPFEDDLDEDAELLPDTAPELQELAQRLVTDHYAAWPDIPVPALDGRTPADAVADPDGRELVEALLVGIERNLARSYPWLEESPAQAIRARLGL